MLKVGITGNIGSGKSTACRIFEMLGVKVYSADDRARLLMQKPEIIQAITNIFGEEIIDKDRQIDRKKLGGIVFDDPEKLKKLEGVIHPATEKDFAKWCEENKDEPYVLKEAAILFESGTYKGLDKIIVIHADEGTRISRVVDRDKSTPELVLQRARNQWKEEEKIKRADYLIENNGKQLLIPQIIHLHHVLRALSGSLNHDL